MSIVLRGELLESSVAGLDREVAAMLDDLPMDCGVIFDLEGAQRCDPKACRRLASIQRRLGAHGCRTAWLAHAPRLRGVAWWIVQAARDGHAMPVLDERAAEDWLAAQELRPDPMPPARRSSRLRLAVP